MDLVELTVPQLAAALHCSVYTLYERIRTKPHSVPPFVNRGHGHVRFPYPAFQAWLARREQMRAEHKAPHLRWTEPPFKKALSGRAAVLKCRKQGLAILERRAAA